MPGRWPFHIRQSDPVTGPMGESPVNGPDGGVQVGVSRGGSQRGREPRAGSG